MGRQRASRDIALRYDDGFRGGIAIAAGLPVILIPFVAVTLQAVDFNPVLIVAGTCAALSCSFLVYVVWTHVVFTSDDTGALAHVGAVQFHRRASTLTRLLGFGSAESWAISAAGAALAVALAAAVFGAREGGVLLALLVLLTGAAAWASVAYAFALRYFRQHMAGERFRFDIEEAPRFTDFLSLAIMISAAGTISPAAPRSRAGLSTVRTHTVIAFVFNALVVAMTVSLIVGLISTNAGAAL
ncbi:Protein of unknown function [Paramicrobacterium humi]|uniref:DUF1345 domain-containing protein n=1 Tax=Paramicrobacterium humi TaxID=640635 RepID=A0A1H4QHG9_9MICO|nr:DUF1345 domain-containing protein [Microbacterium humi]SEC19047.1 Protein of unknown function [Microbacterium humi]